MLDVGYMFRSVWLLVDVFASDRILTDCEGNFWWNEFPFAIILAILAMLYGILVHSTQFFAATFTEVEAILLEEALV